MRRVRAGVEHCELFSPGDFGWQSLRAKQEKRARSFGMAVLPLWPRTSGTGEVRSRRTIARVRLPCNAANVTDDGAIPPFDALPRLPGSGVQHAWDVWGRGDNLGSLNPLTRPGGAGAAARGRTRRRG